MVPGSKALKAELASAARYKYSEAQIGLLLVSGLILTSLRICQNGGKGWGFRGFRT